MDTALRVCVGVLARLSTFWSAATTSAAHAPVSRKSPVLPSLDLDAPEVEDAVGEDEFEVSAALAAQLT